jgi:hypothetical protein
MNMLSFGKTLKKGENKIGYADQAAPILIKDI